MWTGLDIFDTFYRKLSIVLFVLVIYINPKKFQKMCKKMFRFKSNIHIFIFPPSPSYNTDSTFIRMVILYFVDNVHQVDCWSNYNYRIWNGPNYLKWQLSEKSCTSTWELFIVYYVFCCTYFRNSTYTCISLFMFCPTAILSVD